MIFKRTYSAVTEVGLPMTLTFLLTAKLVSSNISLAIHNCHTCQTCDSVSFNIH